ncbi:GumC domain-containing protein [Hymenobacter tenuis]
MSERSYSLLGLWPIINRWKNLVLAALVLAFVISLGVALLLPNIYKSTAIFFPTNPQNSDPDRIVEGGKLELGGRTEDLDRVITVGESQPVAELMLKRFNLYEHYKVGSPGDDKAESEALRLFADNLSIVRNERDVIELTFEDEDKVLAARITNAMVAVIDSINQQLTLENRRNVLGLYKQRYEFLNKEYEHSRRQVVRARRQYGIFGPEQQSRYLAREIIQLEKNLGYTTETRGLRRALQGIKQDELEHTTNAESYLSREIIETESALQQANRNDGPKTASLKRALRALTRADGGSAINMENYINGIDSLSLLTARVTDLQDRLVKAQGEYETAELSIKARISSLYVVQKAYPATKKSKPVRWLIVVGSVFLTLAFSIVLITLLELYRRSQRPSAPAL